MFTSESDNKSFFVQKSDIKVCNSHICCACVSFFLDISFAFTFPLTHLIFCSFSESSDFYGPILFFSSLMENIVVTIFLVWSSVLQNLVKSMHSLVGIFISFITSKIVEGMVFSWDQVKVAEPKMCPLILFLQRVNRVNPSEK